MAEAEDLKSLQCGFESHQGHMGTENRRLEIVAVVSRHNSPRDLVHDIIWEQFTKEIQRVIDGPYSELWKLINIEII